MHPYSDIFIFRRLFVSPDADRTPDLMQVTIGEQFEIVKAGVFQWIQNDQPVSEFGDMSIKDMKIGEFFGKAKAREGKLHE